MQPLPGGFRLRQQVVALYELLLNSDMKVPLGSVGHIIGSLGEDRVTVLFESLSKPTASQGEDQPNMPEYPVSVNIREVAARRPLVGGFSIAQRVQASMSLVVGSRVVVHAGCRGTVLAEFSDTRLTVVFETSETGAPNCCNVLPLEILPWCQTLPELAAGTMVRAVHHLMSPHAIIVPAGSHGTILGGVDSSLVFVSFDNGPSMAASINSLERIPDSVSDTDCKQDSSSAGSCQSFCCCRLSVRLDRNFPTCEEETAVPDRPSSLSSISDEDVREDWLFARQKLEALA